MIRVPGHPVRRRFEPGGSQQGLDERALEGLVHLGGLLAAVSSPDDVASQVVEYSGLLSGLPASLVYLTSEQGGELRPSAAEGVDLELFAEPLRLIDVAALDLERTGPCVVAPSSLGSPAFTDSCAGSGFQQVWVAPLVIEGVRLAGVLVGLDRRLDPPAPQQLHVFRLLTLLAMNALSSALQREAEEKATRELLERERRIALTLQDNFVHPLPIVNGLEFAVASETAYAPELVGGDFHDVFALPDGRVAIVIGDVEGKGVAAAGMTETVRTAIQSFALIEPSPDFVLAKTNELLIHRRHEEGQSVTVFLLVLDLTKSEAVYASAGHPPPVVVGASSCRSLDVSFGLPLGSLLTTYPTSRTLLRHDDTVVMYSDGVTEARRQGEQFGEERLIDALCPLHSWDAQRIADHLRDRVIGYGDRLSDDMHILVVRMREA